MPILAKETKWGEDNPIDNVPELTEEELGALDKRKEAFDKLLATEGKAKYKIEVIFSHVRSSRTSSPGMLSLWESGTKLHGGGDTKVYWCPGKELKVSDCTGLIPDSSAGYGYLTCAKCGTTWKGEQVIGEIFYRLSPNKWAEVLLKHYVSVGHNADVYLKYPKTDLRIASGKEQAKQHMGELLAKARADRQQYIYPLRNIIKDVGAGSDILVRFHAFLTA